MLDNFSTKQKIILVGVCVIILGGIIYNVYSSSSDMEVLEENQTSSLDEVDVDNETVGQEKEFVIVHIAGCVRNPGIVKLEEGSRIEDAINQAGGLTEDADISNVNLAYFLEDGSKIKIPSINDPTEEIISSDSVGEIKNDEKEKSQGVVNINDATEFELQQLPGIGFSIANQIIEYRKENGDFKTIEDIKNVSGIGEAKYEKIKDKIKVK